MKKLIGLMILVLLLLGSCENDVHSSKNDAVLRTENALPKKYGGAGSDAGICIKHTLDGGSIVTGYITVTKQSPEGCEVDPNVTCQETVSKDVYILKLGLNGETIWEQNIGDDQDYKGFDVRELTTDDGNGNKVATGYIVVGEQNAGSSFSSMRSYILRLDLDGNIVWHTTYEYYSRAISVDAAPDGGFYVTGQIVDPINFSTDIYLAKFSSEGIMQWLNEFEYYLADDMGITVRTLDDGIVIAGRRTGLLNEYCRFRIIKTDFEGNVIWDKLHGSGFNYDATFELSLRKDGGFTIIGTMFYSGTSDIYLMKLDSDGDIVFDYLYHLDNDQIAYSVKETSDEGYIIAGTRTFTVGEEVDDGWGGTYTVESDTNDGYLLRLDKDGNFIWHQNYGGAEEDAFYSIDVDAYDVLAISGITYDPSTNNSDIYIYKLNKVGELNSSLITNFKDIAGNTIDPSLVNVNQVPIPEQFYYPGEIVTFAISDSDRYKLESVGGPNINDLDEINALSNYKIVMNENKELTFVFNLKNELVIEIVGNGTVLKTPDKNWFDNGDVVELTFTAANGYRFEGLAGDDAYQAVVIDDANHKYSVTMNGNVHLKVFFVDVDECAEEIDDCSEGAECINTEGLFSCECYNGFDPANNCQDIDECQNVSCGSHATCNNYSGGYECVCETGYQKDVNSNCINIDECAANTFNCAWNEQCVDTDGAYTCTCIEGETRYANSRIETHNLINSWCYTVQECIDVNGVISWQDKEDSCETVGILVTEDSLAKTKLSDQICSQWELCDSEAMNANYGSYLGCRSDIFYNCVDMHEENVKNCLNCIEQKVQSCEDFNSYTALCKECQNNSICNRWSTEDCNEGEHDYVVCTHDKELMQKRVCVNNRWYKEGTCGDFCSVENAERYELCPQDKTKIQKQKCVNENWVAEGSCVSYKCHIGEPCFKADIAEKERNFTTETRIPMEDTIHDSGTNLYWQVIHNETTSIVEGVEVTDYVTTLGSPDKKTLDEAKTHCNDLIYGGFTDWRLPYVHELQSMINYQNFMPAAYYDFPEPFYTYWSYEAFIQQSQFRTVHTPSGSIMAIDPFMQLNAVCVRSNHDFSADLYPRYFHKYGSIYDMLTGLMWQYGKKVNQNATKATDYCDNLELDGYTDWRLPNVHELSSLLVYDERLMGDDKYSNLPDPENGEGLSYDYWTATPAAENYRYNWFINFDAGLLDVADKVYNSKGVKCVRNIK